MVTPLRIVFFGTPQFAEPSLEALVASAHQVVGVVTQPDRPRGRGQQMAHSPVKAKALALRLPVYQPDRLRDSEVAHTLEGWAPDLGVVAAYGKLIPEQLLRVPQFGMINVHGSLLPRYRGAAPVHRAVIDGAAETGVTIMRVVAQLDAGGMFAKAVRQIGPDETAETVQRDLARLGASLLVTVVDQISEGTAVEVPQDDARATYAARLTKEEGLIDWSLPAAAIHDRVRGLYPWPHAYSYLKDERLVLLRTRVESSPTAEPPGTIVDVSNDLIHVATGQSGRLAIEQLQPDGRRPMTARDYLSGHAVPVGARLTGR